MDLSVNKTFKDFMKREFSEWYSSIVYQNFTTNNDENPPPVDLHMSIMEPLVAQWLIKAYVQPSSNKQFDHGKWV